MANNFSIKKNKKKRLNYLYGHLRRLNINNTARVIYETGLANLQLDSGPGGSWEILRGTWREIN